MTDQELKDLVASIAQAQLKTDAQLAKTDAQLAKTDAQLAKTDAQLAKTDARLVDRDAEWAKRDAEWAKTEVRLVDRDAEWAKRDAEWAKRDAEWVKIDARLNKIGQMVGAMGNNQGDVAEEYFVNSLKDKRELAGKKFDVLIPNFIIKAKDITDEYDILLVNGDELAMIEVKYKIHTKDIEKLEKKVKNLKALPQYKNYRVYAGVAGFRVPQDVMNLAKKNGYFVLQRKGDMIETMAEGMRAA